MKYLKYLVFLIFFIPINIEALEIKVNSEQIV